MTLRTSVRAFLHSRLGSRLRHLQDRLAQRLPSGIVADDWHVEYLPRLGVRLLLNHGSYIDWLIHRDGCFEPYVLAAIEKELRSDHGMTTFIDVGANIGQMSLFVRRHFPKVTVCSFEPYPPVFAQHEANRLINGLDYDLFSIALGAKRGQMHLHVPITKAGWHLDRANPGMVSVHADMYRAGEVVETEVVSFDEFAKDHPQLFAGRALFKIDVEGAELDVLRGMKGFLDRAPYPTLIVELLLNQFRDQSLLAFELLYSHDYVAYTLGGEPVQTTDALQRVGKLETDFVFRRAS